MKLWNQLLQVHKPKPDMVLLPLHLFILYFQHEIFLDMSFLIQIM